MRRMSLIICLMLAAALLASCTPQPDLVGRWESSPDETLCATVLFLSSDGTFQRMQEGCIASGTWSLKDTRLTLTVPPVHKMDSGSMFAYTLDKAAGALNTIDGLCLYRQPAPDIVGYWMNATDDAPRHVSLHLMESGLFVLQIYDRDLPLNTLDGWEVYHTGEWSLGGLALTLRCDDKSVITTQLSLDSQTIDMGDGVVLKNYMAQ